MNYYKLMTLDEIYDEWVKYNLKFSNHHTFDEYCQHYIRRGWRIV